MESTANKSDWKARSPEKMEAFSSSTTRHCYEPYYPINDEKNNAMFAKYQEEAEKNDKVIFCGRLADYKYYDMHVVIERALEVVEKEFTK